MSSFHIAFSGHRPNDQPGRSLAELESTSPLIDELLSSAIAYAKSHDSTITLHTGIAEGSDRIFCQRALALNISLRIHLPLAENEFKQDFSSAEAWALSRSIIEQARSIHGENAVHTTPGNHPRPQCYAETNREMLAQADALIVIWDEKPARGKGGTQEAWQLASENSIKKALINPVKQMIVVNELNKHK